MKTPQCTPVVEAESSVENDPPALLLEPQEGESIPPSPNKSSLTVEELRRRRKEKLAAEVKNSSVEELEKEDQVECKNMTEEMHRIHKCASIPSLEVEDLDELPPASMEVKPRFSLPQDG